MMNRNSIGYYKHRIQNQLQMICLPIFLIKIIEIVEASQFNDDDYTNDDMGIFESSRRSVWLYSSLALSIEYHGCTWSYTASTDDAGCLEASSEDGTTSWYLMSNCRRTQAVYSVYSVDDGYSASCNKNTYQGTFITKTGMYSFLSYLTGYDEYPLMTGDDDQLDENYFPMCEKDDNGYYVSVGCSSDGELTLDQFSDAYCLNYKSTYSTLSSVSSKLNSYKSCHQVYSSKNGNSPEYSAVGYLLDYSDSCNQLDSPYCYDIDGSKTKSLKSTSDGAFKNVKHYAGQTFASKMKYALGSVFVVSSFVMFIGILFTNRKKRRAMLRRHFRRKSAARRRNASKSREREDSQQSAPNKKKSGGRVTQAKNRPKSSSDRERMDRVQDNNPSDDNNEDEDARGAFA